MKAKVKDNAFDIFREGIASEDFVYIDGCRLIECNGMLVVKSITSSFDKLALRIVKIACSLDYIHTFDEYFSFKCLTDDGLMPQKYETAKQVIIWLDYYLIDEKGKNIEFDTNIIITALIVWLREHNKLDHELITPELKMLIEAYAPALSKTNA